jgi:hypothetical protein
MRRILWSLAIAVLCLALLLPGTGRATPVAPSAPAVQADLDWGRMPVYFIENQGQVDERVAYYVQGSDKTLYFTAEGVTFALTAPPGEPSAAGRVEGRWERGAGPPVSRLASARWRFSNTETPIRWAVKLDFLGANPGVRPVAEERQETVISYFKGRPVQWRAGLPTYARLVYRDLWPGIDLIYQGTANRLKYQFVVHPGADPAQIRLAYRGASGVAVNDAGQLEVTTPLGGFADDTPVAYQEVGGQQDAVAAAYDLAPTPIQGEGVRFGFALGPYDPTRTLVLDPAVLVYCGYIGGLGEDQGRGIAVDGAGQAYVTGWTQSSEATFPVVGGPDLAYNDGYADAFVAKVRADGSGLVYAGYIGGADKDKGRGIAVDGAGQAYVTGYTYSDETTFPVVGGPDLTYNGSRDAFVAKVRADGSGLVYAGYIGGSDAEFGVGIAVDGAGQAYVAGDTWSTEATFPVVGGPDLSYNESIDAFVARVRADGTGLDYCGYIGGSDNDFAEGIAVDGAGQAYVTGWTGSYHGSFPVTVGPDLTFNGGWDAFVAKVRADGSGLDYCGYIGGNYTTSDIGYGIAIDGVGQAYVTGTTESGQTNNFPVVGGPDLTYNGSGDAFVAKVRADGTGLDYCGYIGGGGEDRGSGIAVDGAGQAYVTGYTESSETSFPVVGGPDPYYSGEGDAFVAKVRADGGGLDYCGYIGGWQSESGYDEGHYGGGIAVDGAGQAYVAGTTASTPGSLGRFPATRGPDLTYNGGSSDAFVARVGDEGGSAYSVYLPLVLRNR